MLCGACAIGWATLRVMYIMLGSVRALYCMSYRYMSVCGRCEREELVLMVQMGAVSAVSSVCSVGAVGSVVAAQGLDSSDGSEVAAQGLDSSEGAVKVLTF